MNKTNNKSLLAISFSQGFTSPNIPIASFTQGDKQLYFIIDTGSDKNLINSSALADLEYEEHELPNKQLITGVGGTKEVSACKINFEGGKVNYSTVFLVADLDAPFEMIREAHGIQLHGMLGSIFLKENNLIIDFNNLMLYSKNDLPRD